MKKVISSLLSVALSCSMLFAFAGSVSAATPEPTSVDPVVTGKVTMVKSGRAIIEFSLDSKATYGVEYDTDFSEYVGDTASGFSTIDVQLTLSDEVDSLFSAIVGASVTGSNKVTVDGKKVIYTFGVSEPTAYAQNGDVLFKLTGTLKDSGMTIDNVKTYNLVKSFDLLNAYTKVWPVSAGRLDTYPTYETAYRSDGNGDYNTITAKYEYSAPAKTIDSVTVTPATVTLDGKGTQAFTATVEGTADDKSVTWSADLGTIDAEGNYTAPEATSEVQTATITATSNFDGSKKGTATVTINAKTPDPVAPTATITADANKGADKGVFFKVGLNGMGSVIKAAKVDVAGPAPDGVGTRNVTFNVGGLGEISGELNFYIGIKATSVTSGTFSGIASVTTDVSTVTTDAASASIVE